MRISTLFVVVVLLVHGADAVTYKPDSLVSGVTALVVDVEVEGTVTWHSNSEEEVIINVTEADGIAVDFTKDALTNTETVMVYYTKQCHDSDGTFTVLSSFSLILACSLLAWLSFSRGHTPFIWLLIIFVLCITFSVHANHECVGVGADIDIYVPGNFTFGTVALKSSIGSIKVDEQLIDSGTPVACSGGIDKQECPRCCSGLGKCVGGECMCDIGYRNGTEDCSNRTEITFKLHTNPADPVIVEGITPDGDIISLVGEKAENGTILSVDQFQIHDSEDNTTYVSLEDGSPSTATSSSGAFISFDWNDNVTSVHITAISPDGSLQETMNIDLTEAAEEEQNPVKRQASTSIHTKEDRNTNAERPHVKEPTKHHQRRQSDSTAGAAIATVVVSSCGEPDENAIVGANVLRDYKESTMQSSKIELYNGIKTSNPGVFHIKIPTIPSSTIGEEIGDVCKSINDKLSPICTWYGRLKTVLKTFGITSTVIKNPENIICPRITVPYVVAVCYAVFKTFKWYCDNIAAPTVPIDEETDGLGLNPTPNRGEIICMFVTQYVDPAIDSFRDETILMTPYAIFLGYNKVSAEGQVIELTPGFTGLLPNTFTITNDQTNPQIIILDVFPFDPAPGQGYVVTVTYQCSTADTIMYMSIYGTDDYFDDRYCHGTVNACVLYVPGAEALVEDTVTITLSSNQVGGYMTTRTAHIIF